ncbi:MAG: permease [Pseudomonadota bacterium]|nr:permease [Pseudomonadota bacterium]
MDGKKLLIPTLVVALITIVLLALVHVKGGDSGGAVHEGLTSLVKVLPVLAFALVAASCLVYLVPAEVVAKWVGKDSGAKGIFIGSVAGMIVPPGGPIVVYAIAAGLIKSGASFATMVAFVTAYNLLALHRFPFEMTMMGWKFLALRSASVILLAPLAGFLAAGLVALYGKSLR